MTTRLSTIYALIDNRTNECRYVGKTVHKLQTRLAEHLRSAFIKRLNTHRDSWVRSCGRNNITVIALEEAGDNWAESESFWISYLKLLGANLTNATTGGEGVHGWKATEEYCRNIAIRRTGQKHSPETKAKLSLVRKGHKQSIDTCIKKSKSHLGKKLTPEHCLSISDGQKGRVHSDKTKRLISEANKGSTRSDAHKKSISMAQMGKPKSETHRLKISEAIKAFHQKKRGRN